MKITPFILLSFCFVAVFGQTKVTFNPTHNYQNFKGGDLNQFIKKNVTYPKSAREIGIQGKVIVEFIIEKDGAFSNIKTIKGIGGGCD